MWNPLLCTYFIKLTSDFVAIISYNLIDLPQSRASLLFLLATSPQQSLSSIPPLADLGFYFAGNSIEKSDFLARETYRIMTSSKSIRDARV